MQCRCGKRPELKRTKTNLEDDLNTAEMFPPPWFDLRYQNLKKSYAATPLRFLSDDFFFLVFLHFIFQISACYEHVSGWLCSDTSNCRYISAVVFEH